MWPPGSTSAGMVTDASTSPAPSAVRVPSAIGVESNVTSTGLVGREAHGADGHRPPAVDRRRRGVTLGVTGAAGTARRVGQAGGHRGDGADAAVGGQAEAEHALRGGAGPLAAVGGDAGGEGRLVVGDGAELGAGADLQRGEEGGSGVGRPVLPARAQRGAASPVVLQFTAPVPKKPPDGSCWSSRKATASATAPATAGRRGDARGALHRERRRVGIALGGVGARVRLDGLERVEGQHVAEVVQPEAAVGALLAEEVVDGGGRRTPGGAVEGQDAEGLADAVGEVPEAQGVGVGEPPSSSPSVSISPRRSVSRSGPVLTSTPETSSRRRVLATAFAARSVGVSKPVM